jgi:hypothetical protein
MGMDAVGAGDIEGGYCEAEGGEIGQIEGFGLDAFRHRAWVHSRIVGGDRGRGRARAGYGRGSRAGAGRRSQVVVRLSGVGMVRLGHGMASPASCSLAEG